MLKGLYGTPQATRCGAGSSTPVVSFRIGGHSDLHMPTPAKLHLDVVDETHTSTLAGTAWNVPGVDPVTRFRAAPNALGLEYPSSSATSSSGVPPPSR